MGNAWNTPQPPKPFQPHINFFVHLCAYDLLFSSLFTYMFQAFNKTPQNDGRWAGGKDQVFLVHCFPFLIFFFTVFNFSNYPSLSQ